MPFADPALGAAYTSFLGHLAAIFYLKNTGMGSKTISGVARSLSCTKSQMIEGAEKMHKNTYEDPVSAYSALPWWKSPEPCESCYHTNFRFCFTHDTNNCKPVRKQGGNGGTLKNNNRGNGFNGSRSKASTEGSQEHPGQLNGCGWGWHINRAPPSLLGTTNALMKYVMSLWQLILEIIFQCRRHLICSGCSLDGV